MRGSEEDLLVLLREKADELCAAAEKLEAIERHATAFAARLRSLQIAMCELKPGDCQAKLH